MPMKLDLDEPKTEMNRFPQAGSLEDELSAEYDLTRLRVRKIGLLRTKFGGVVLRYITDGIEDSQCRDSK